MSLEAISTTGIKEKLRELRYDGGKGPEIIYTFSENLAERLNCEITPSGFIATAAMLIRDSMTGIHHYTKEVINNKLTGLNHHDYVALSEYLPILAEQVCPEDFAKDVLDLSERKNLYGPRKLSRKF